MSPALSRSILILGGHGMLAAAIKRNLSAQGLGFVDVDRDTVDLTSATERNALFDKVQPTLVFNCAAFTNVDACETDRTTADAVNAHMPGAVAELCKQRGAFLVHISTDFVFDGSSTQPYRETDEPKPVSAYGAGKLLGEDLIQDSGLENWLICRTAWLFGRPGNCFPKTMVNAAKAGKPLSVVGDQFGSPTLTDDLAQAIFALLNQGSRGLFHVTNSGRTNWADFTKSILMHFDIDHPVKSITSADWKSIKPASATRPASSVLNCDKLTKATNLHMRPWEVALADYKKQVSEHGF